MSRSMAHFQSSIVRIDLTPDSRGYALMSLSRSDLDSTNSGNLVSCLTGLTCEYLADIAIASMQAMDWIEKNCEEIRTDKGRHLYYRFKNLTNENNSPN